MILLQFEVPGTPVAKGRPRITTIGGFARTYTPAKTVAYEALVAHAAAKAMGDQPLAENPVYMIIYAYFPIPISWSKKRKLEASSGSAYHTTKPDADNIAKAVSDALNGVVWKDDSQVAVLRVIKTYAEEAKTTVIIEELG